MTEILNPGAAPGGIEGAGATITTSAGRSFTRTSSGDDPIINRANPIRLACGDSFDLTLTESGLNVGEADSFEVLCVPDWPKASAVNIGGTPKVEAGSPAKLTATDCTAPDKEDAYIIYLRVDAAGKQLTTRGVYLMTRDIGI